MPARARRPIGWNGSRIDRLAVGSGAAATAIALLQLVWPTTHGVADNGDFARLLCHLDLLPDLPHGEPPYFTQVNTTWHHTYLASQGVTCDYHSPAQRVLEVAEHISWHLPGHHGLDLRVVAALYSVGLGVAIALLVWGLPARRWVRWVGAGAAVALLTDFDFIGHFTGALSEPLGYLALIATAGLLLRWWRSDGNRLGTLASLTVAGSILVATKPQYAAMAAPLAVAVLIGSTRRARPHGDGQPRLRRWAPGLAAAAVLAGVSVWTIQQAPASFDAINRYDAFFYGLLPHADDPAATLRDFGVPAHFIRYSGASWWSPGSGRRDPGMPAVLPHITIPRMARYWALHPTEALGAGARGWRAGASAHLDYLGKTTDLRDSQTNWCDWCPASWAGRRLRAATPVLVPVAWLGAVAAAAWTVRRRRGPDAAALAATAATVAGLAASQLVVSILGEGDYELTKHLYLMTAANVLLVVIAAAAIAGALEARR